MFARTTPSPTWQSCARCTYDITKLFGPTLVLNDCEVPRLMVLYSRTTVLCPISTPSPSSADDDTIAVGWILAVIDPAPSRPSLPQRRAPRQPSQRRASCTPRLGSG